MDEYAESRTPAVTEANDERILATVDIGASPERVFRALASSEVTAGGSDPACSTHESGPATRARAAGGGLRASRAAEPTHWKVNFSGSTRRERSCIPGMG